MPKIRSNPLKPYFKVCPYLYLIPLYLDFRRPKICAIRPNTKATLSVKIQKHKYYNQIEKTKILPYVAFCNVITLNFRL